MKYDTRVVTNGEKGIIILSGVSVHVKANLELRSRRHSGTRRRTSVKQTRVKANIYYR